MAWKRLFKPIQLLFFLVLFGGFIGSNYAQEKPLRDPKEVKIGDITLFNFLKLHKQGLLEAIPAPPAEIDSLSVSVQVDYFLKQKGYGNDFLYEEDLSKTDLSKTDLRFLCLKEANLTGCSFEKADLSYVNLKEANLTDAMLIKTNLTRSNIKEALVKNADFSGAILTNADIHEAGSVGSLEKMGTPESQK